MIRASGQASKALGVEEALADPVITLHNVKGAVIARSDNSDEGGLAPEIVVMTAAAGATPFRDGSKDAAMVVDLAPGVYSIHVTGADATTGVALLELFDLGLLEKTALYAELQLNWDGENIQERSGPTFSELNSTPPEDGRRTKRGSPNPPTIIMSGSIRTN